MPLQPAGAQLGWSYSIFALVARLKSEVFPTLGLCGGPSPAVSWRRADWLTPGGGSSVTDQQGPKVGRRHVDSGAGRGVLLRQDYTGQVRNGLAGSLAVLAIDSGHSWLVTS